jgi:hypothetical protein
MLSQRLFANVTHKIRLIHKEAYTNTQTGCGRISRVAIFTAVRKNSPKVVLAEVKYNSGGHAHKMWSKSYKGGNLAVS